MADHSNKYFPCFLCQKRPSPVERRTINEKNALLIQSVYKSEPRIGVDVICNKCRCQLRIQQPNLDENKENETVGPKPVESSVNIPIKRVAKASSL